MTMTVSILTPAYNASATIADTLISVFASTLPDNWLLDVIVVDDGSVDGEQLADVVVGFGGVRLIRQDENLGKNAAVNTGVAHSQGDILIVLDADDTLVDGWPGRLQGILENWPDDAPLCFSACETKDGRSTVVVPTYSGPFRFEDIVDETYMGEYLPIFRGDAIRAAQGYRDAGRGVGCELWTYLNYAKQNDLWISSVVLRVYNDQASGSLSSALFTPQGAARLVKCYDLIFAEFGEDYKRISPRNFLRRQLRQAVFAAIAGQRKRAWALWLEHASFLALSDTVAAFILIVLGRQVTTQLVSFAKKFGFVRQYG